MDLKQIRRQLVIAMGSTCSGCGAKSEPDALVIHHTQFEQGKPLGYNNRQRQEMLYEFARTGKVPPDTKLLCDRCNRKRHKYRPSNADIFGSAPTRRQIVKGNKSRLIAKDKQSMPASPPMEQKFAKIFELL
jgi:hypothetical protein